MRPIFLCIVGTAVLNAATVHADEFSWELTGGAQRSELGPVADADVASLGATYYFRPVDEQDRAYALAPFLGRASHIGARYHEDKTTSQALVITVPIISPSLPLSTTTVVTRAAGRGVSGRHVWRSSGWYAGGGFAESDAAFPAPVSASFSLLGDDLTTRSVTFGKYVGRSTSVELSLEAAAATLTSELFQPCTGLLCFLAPPTRITTVVDTEAESVGVAAVHVGRLGRFDYALAGGVTRSEVDSTLEITETPQVPQVQPLPRPPDFQPTTPAGGVALFPARRSSSQRDRYTLAAELFPTRKLGIRASYARLDEDMIDTSYELAATWFFRRSIGARLALGRTKSIAQVGDVDTVGLQLMGRL